jgi:uncharacterized protein
MRELLANNFKDAMKAQDKRRVATLRLVQAAINDRDIANRGLSKDPINDADIVGVLRKMIKQRLDSITLYSAGGREDLAEQERQEIAIISEFLPEQMCADTTRSACQEVITDINASGLRDMGKCMAALKERYSGRMDFSQATTIVKGLLQ